LFVTVSSRLTGEVGSSSNPISGMTVATLLITCLVFLGLGWTAADPYFVTALSIGGIVCIAASNGGTTSQDLKTGFWVGSTPRKQQIAILVGALASALVLGSLLIFLNSSRTYYQKVDANSPEARVLVTEGQFFRDGGKAKTEIPPSITSGRTPIRRPDKSASIWSINRVNRRILSIPASTAFSKKTTKAAIWSVLTRLRLR